MADSMSNEMDRMLTDARKMLEKMRAGRAEPSSDDETVEGVGEAAEGRVRATVVSGGRLKSVELNPRAMRLASEELGEHIVTAVNAALEDLRTKAQQAAGAEAIDTAALGRQVEELQNQSLRQMQMISQALTDAVSKAAGNR